LKSRLIVGPILIAALLGVIWLDNRLDDVALPASWAEAFGRENPPRGVLLFGVGLGLMPLAARELNNIFAANGIMTRWWLTSLAAMLGLALSYVIPTKLDQPMEVASALAIVPTGLIAVFVASLITFSRHRNVEGVTAAAGGVIFAMVYLGLMAGFLLALRRWHSAWWIVGVILTTKMCDTGAYFTGKTIGRHKMIPWLSPGKTWEGLVGGVVVAAATGALLAWLSGLLPREEDHFAWHLGAVCGVVFAIVGQLGDLAVSLFKRGAGMKDSSNLLPGLGGVLDVLDSPLMVAPVAFWLLMLLG